MIKKILIVLCVGIYSCAPKSTQEDVPFVKPVAIQKEKTSAVIDSVCKMTIHTDSININYLNMQETLYSADELGLWLDANTTMGREVKIGIKSDKEVPAEDMMLIFDTFKKKKAENISFIVPFP